MKSRLEENEYIVFKKVSRLYVEYNKLTWKRPFKKIKLLKEYLEKSFNIIDHMILTNNFTK